MRECAVLAKNHNFPWAKKLNSQARQAHADRAWAAIQRFYQNCRLGKPGKKGYPKYKKFSRSIEYKNSGWKLSADRKQITFTDGFEVGTMALWTSRDLVWYSEKQISRVRVIRRADGYYTQFLVDWDRREAHEFQGKMTGIDLGLKEFYTDSDGNTVDNPRYLRKSERRLKMLQRRVSKKHQKGQKQSNRYHQARKALAKQHLKISRQRKDKAIIDALALVKSNDLIVYVGAACAKRIDLKIQNMVKNHHLAKSISDSEALASLRASASWYQFTIWLQYFAKIYGVIVVAVPPHNTTVDCSNCGAKVKKTLSTRTHRCSKCGTVLDRDHNAAKNILAKGFKLVAEYLNSTEGHSGSDPKRVKAQGETGLWLKSPDALVLSQLCELRTKVSGESSAIPR